ncbi:MAG TPA: biotin--[acetyl-CoA-carboxylase] ligase [Chitinophagaceae bacterium]|nr:biotin--[acetyl-CoA-carboxylase] ligase [Chitinophagaceae bacterium]
MAFRDPAPAPFIELQSVDSTNTYALGEIHAGRARHGLAVFAREQVRGRGQRGRSWSSEPGANIILSLVIDPRPLSLAGQFGLSACVALAVREFYAGFAGDSTRIKWPNDIYWENRKAGGILIENVVGTESGWQWAVAGIGLNINQTRFDPSLPNPVSLRQITGRQFETVDLARDLSGRVLHRLEELITSGPYLDGILAQYNEHLYGRDQEVTLRRENRVFRTRVQGVAETGDLITRSGSLEERFVFGEISWVI